MRADVSVGPPADTPAPSLAPPSRRVPPRRALRLLPYLLFLSGGLLVTARLWRNPGRRVSSANPAGQSLSDWMLAHGARFLTHGGNPLFSDRMNVPDGVNIMANPSFLGLSVPLAPVTWLLGVDVGYALLLTLALAVTAAAWYRVLSRTLLPNRLAAFLAGALCGFAPGLISHAHGQPALVAQFLVPYLAYHAAKLAAPAPGGAPALWRRPWARHGLVLGLLVVWQVFVGEEILLDAAGVGLVFVLVLALFRREVAWRVWRPVLGGLGVAAVVAGALLAYPLWFQFAGRGSWRGLPFDPDGYVTDPATYFTFARESLAGSSHIGPRFVLTATEENAFFGVPLVLLTVIFVGWLWREYLLVRAAAITGVLVAGVAAGAHPHLHGIALGLPGPYALLRHVPLLGLTTPTRYSLLLVPLVALILGLAVQRAGELTPPAGAVRRTWLLLWTATCLAALLPVAPTPLTAVDREPVPAFFASGEWRRYVPEGRSFVAVPLASWSYPDPMWWSARTRLGAAIPRGYFVGPKGPEEPGGPPDRRGSLDPPPRPTASLLDEVWRTGVAAPVDARDRAAAATDLAFWRAAVVVLPPGTAEEALWKTVTRLLGRQPVFTGEVWVWTVPS